MMMAKVADDLLMVVTRSDLEMCVEIIGKRFPISKTVIDRTIRFNGCTIRTDAKGDISMYMSDYLEEIGCMFLDRERRKQADEKVTGK